RVCGPAARRSGRAGTRADVDAAHQERPGNMRISDLKIIVTGGAQGMGAYFSKKLHEAGARVAAGDVNEAGLAALPEGVARRRLDVSNEADVESFVAWAHGAMGGLNGLVNNAGILRDGLLVKKDKATGAVTKLSAEQ